MIALNVSLNICHNQLHNSQDKGGMFVVGACYFFSNFMVEERGFESLRFPLEILRIWNTS